VRIALVDTVEGKSSIRLPLEVSGGEMAAKQDRCA
jgi:hypothetical protein